MCATPAVGHQRTVQLLNDVDIKMKTQKLIQIGALSAVLGMVSSAAQAVAITDVTFRFLPGDYRNADTAALFSGNDSLADINALSGAFAGDPWSLLDKTDSGSTEFQGVTFTLAAPEDSTAGGWSLEWAESGTPGLPLEMDIVFVTKAGPSWAAYLFESVTFSSFPLAGDGTFEISWLNSEKENI